MRGLDTNVILRWLIDDESNRAQCERATQAIAEGDNHLSIVALSETIWVLETTYKIKGEGIRAVVESMLEMNTLKVSDPELVREAILERTRCAFLIPSFVSLILLFAFFRSSISFS